MASNNQSARGPSPAVIISAGVLAALALACSGCYSKVVGATGPAAEQYRVEQSDRSDTWLDRQVFGEEPSSGTNPRPRNRE